MLLYCLRNRGCSGEKDSLLSWKGEGKNKLYAQAQKWSLHPIYVMIVELPESL